MKEEEAEEEEEEAADGEGNIARAASAAATAATTMGARLSRNTVSPAQALCVPRRARRAMPRKKANLVILLRIGKS